MSKLYSSALVEVCHTISRGEFCKIEGIPKLTQSDIEKIKEYMNLIVKEDIPFIKMEFKLPNIKELIKNNSEQHTLCNYLNKDSITVYSLNDYYDSFGGFLVPSTKYLKKFDLILEENGVILICPQKNNPDQIERHLYQPKLVEVFDEIKDWAKIHDIHYLGDLNEKIHNDKYAEIIRISEALHEYKVSKIAEAITNNKSQLIFIAGPSSSGKTTFANRLRIQLMVQRSKPLTISMDDYFIDRDAMKPDKNGKYDFEGIENVNLELFKQQILSLLSGELIYLRKFDFKPGEGYYENTYTQMNKNSQIIIEGIHGLNPIIFKLFNGYDIYKICINPISQINLDKHNRISSTDCRKIRRIVRDFKNRNINAIKTINMWSNIRRGEERNIFPFLESADVIFNSTLVYEMCVLKKYAEKTLLEIPHDSEAYPEAKRLLSMLSYFLSIVDEAEIPTTSILKEFTS